MLATLNGRRALRAKRLFDIVVALSLILTLAPLFLSLGLVVVLTSGWPIIIGLERVGTCRRLFTLYKFRSMVQNAHLLTHEVYGEVTQHIKKADDPRVTWCGKFLRRSSFDELPQLWNVIKGDMSLVGPRPHEQPQVADLPAYHRNLLYFRPGLTGLPQVLSRNSYNAAQIARLNTFYVKRWHLGLDLWILWKTTGVVVHGHGAC